MQKQSYKVLYTNAIRLQTKSKNPVTRNKKRREKENGKVLEVNERKEERDLKSLKQGG